MRLYTLIAMAVMTPLFWYGVIKLAMSLVA